MMTSGTPGGPPSGAICRVFVPGEMSDVGGTQQEISTPEDESLCQSGTCVTWYAAPENLGNFTVNEICRNMFNSSSPPPLAVIFISLPSLP